MLAGVGAPTPHGVLQFLVETPFAAWGFVPVASGFFTYVVLSLFLEWLIKLPWMEKYMITYPGDEKGFQRSAGEANGPDRADVAVVRERESGSPTKRRGIVTHFGGLEGTTKGDNGNVRLKRNAMCQRNTDRVTKKPMDIDLQWKIGLETTGGLSAWIAGTLNGLLLTGKILDGKVEIYDANGQFSLAVLTLQRFVIEIVGLTLVADLLLYLGHRIQHEIPWLWKNIHSRHHQLASPSPIGTVFIDPLDATLQGSLPLMFSGLFVRPHPITFWVYVCLHIGNNILNHSGIDAWWFDLLTLKCLPLRSKNSHHDAHHRYSNYGKGAKNYAEAFIVWDWMFGTLRQTGSSVQPVAKVVVKC